MAFLDSLREFINANSEYDPTKAQALDGPVNEPDIPATQPDFRLPREEAIYHPDFMAPEDSPQHKVVTENAYEPGGELEADTPVRHAEPDTRYNPSFGIDAPSNIVSTYQVPLTANVVAQILQENPFRVKALIVVKTADITVAPNQGGAVNGFLIESANTSPTEIDYSGNFYAISTGAAVVYVCDFIRMP